VSAAPADELRGTVQQALADLSEVAQWLPGGTIGEAGLAAVILDRLAEEMAEAAAMVRALPAEPAPQAGHTFAAAAALATAVQQEPDFASWLTTLLRTLARQPGTALTANQPGSWDAWLLRQLVRGPLAATSRRGHGWRHLPPGRPPCLGRDRGLTPIQGPAPIGPRAWCGPVHPLSPQATPLHGSALCAARNPSFRSAR
jgi:hypothetical protein